MRTPAASGATASRAEALGCGCSEEDVNLATRSSGNGNDGDPVFVCQATQLPNASESLNPYDFRQYIEDYSSGNVSAGRWIRGVFYITYQS